jgi:hypothetical protein
VETNKIKKALSMPLKTREGEDFCITEYYIDQILENFKKVFDKDIGS